VRFDHVARFIVNPESQRDMTGCETLRSRLRSRLRLARLTTGDRMAAHRKSDSRDDRCAGGFRRCVFRYVGAQ
jgi:hypothetical protein